MTFHDDCIALFLAGQKRWIKCHHLEIAWPPPERLSVMGAEYRRVSMSSLSDEERADKPQLIRVAEYVEE